MSYVLLVLLAVLPWMATAEPHLPTTDNEVLERLPNPDSRLGDLRPLRQRLALEPDNLDLALDLARRYIQLGRAEADPRYYGYAQAVLAPWWEAEEPPPGVLLLRATLRQNRHDFQGALADLDHLLALRPRNGQAWLTQAVVLTVRGRHDDALASCRPLLRLAPGLAAAACMAGPASLSGRAEPAYRLLATTLARASDAAPESRVWALTLQGEIAERLGWYARAEQHFKDALAVGTRDVYLLGAYADFLLDRDRAQEVRALLKDESRADALLLRLALAEQHLRDPALEAHRRTLEARFNANRARGGSLHLGAEARFALEFAKQPQQALELALRNWTIQREPADARIVLEAALAAGQPGMAKPVLDWLKATGLQAQKLSELAARLNDQN